MSPDRTRHGFPLAVATAIGLIVAVVSGVVGLTAHAATAGPGFAVGAGTLLSVFAACGAVGLGTVAAARRVHPGAIVPLGLLAAQGATHVVLGLGHGAAGHVGHGGHGLAVAPGDAAHALHTAADQAAAAAAAMDAATAGHLTVGWAMLLAHLVATLAAAGILAVLAGLWSWLTAQVADLLRDSALPAGALPRPAVVSPERVTDARYLLSRGGLRGPPVAA